MYHRTPLAIELPKVLRSLVATLLVLLLATSAYFFFKMTDNAEKGYLLRENQLKQKDLEAENRILKQQVLDSQALEALKGSKTVKRLAEPTKPIYVLPRGPLSQRNSKFQIPISKK